MNRITTVCQTLCFLGLLFCALSVSAAEPQRVRLALFVAVDGVYNSELIAPYDVLQHSVFRDPNNYIRTAIVAPEKKSFTTFEGIEMMPHYSFADAPPADILIIPSAEHSLDQDLEDLRLIEFLRLAVARAEWVITVCDGAFPLAKTGALDGRAATTFPADRDRLKELFPKIDVKYQERLVVDGKFITSVGGGLSYEPAFWLVEKLYGKEHAAASAKGLVWDWDLSKIPHLIVDRK
jgi:transcriptional regulator GlxA family with amidase domain